MGKTNNVSNRYDNINQNRTRMADPKRSRARMIKMLKEEGITNTDVLIAMSKIPRHLFVPDIWASSAYVNTPLPIGEGQTISQPFTIARMLEYLEPLPEMRVLEVGMGCGYQTALLYALGCEVFGVEFVPKLYHQTVARLKQLGFKKIKTHLGDGTLGLPISAPFDRIIVAAGGPAVPQPLINQLNDPGIMLIPVGTRQKKQRLMKIIKQKNSIISQDMGSTEFVNLVGTHGWNDKKHLI